MARKGKPCGASHISAQKVCRIGLPTEVNRALKAATGNISNRGLWKAVDAHGAPGRHKRYKELRDEVRKEMGGNIVKGPKADKLKQRLIEEGLLPAKSKSKEGDEQKLARLKQEREELVGKTSPSAIARRRELADEIGNLRNKIKDEESFGKQIKKQFGLAPSVPPDLKAELANLGKGERPANVQNTGTLRDLRDKYLDEGIAAGKAKDDEAFGKAQSNFMRVQKELNRREKGEEAQAVSLKKSENVAELAKKQNELELARINAKVAGKESEANKIKQQIEEVKAALVEARKKPDPELAKYNDEQIRADLSLAVKKGDVGEQARLGAEMSRRAKGQAAVPEAKVDVKKVEEAQKRYADLMKKQQDLVKEGKLTEAQEMQRNVNAARRAWEKANAPELNAQKAAMKKAAEETPQGLGPRATEDLRKIDKEIEKKTTAQMGDPNFNWDKSLTKDAEKLASGMFGTAIKDPDNIVVKRGELGQNEAAIMQKAHELGLAPKVYAAQLDGPGNYDRNNRTGRMAMDLADGEPIGNRESKVVEKAYWEARAALHRGGIAHNDMHIQNVFVNKDGKGMFVDMGLAQDSPKAALAEAMGVFTRVPLGAVASRGAGRGGDGDWQVRRWTNIGGEDFAAADRSGDERSVNYLMNRYPTAYKVYANKQKAIKKLKSFGLSNQDVADVMRHGIRSKESSFEVGGMGKLTNEQALQVINTLYDGI